MFKESQLRPQELRKERYREETKINDIEISAFYDDRYENYVLNFPQIPCGEESFEKGVSDTLFKIDDSPENAKEVYDYAVKLADTESDVHEIYKKAEKFARELGEK